MIVEFHNQLADPQRQPATRVVIYNRQGTPIALAVELEDGTVIAETAENDVEFNSLMRNLGLQQTVVCTGVAQRPLREIRFPQKFGR